MNIFGTNLGGYDRFLRFFAGLSLLILAGGDIGRPWTLWIGLLLLGTAALAWCPSYLPFGFKTCAKK